MEIINGIDQGDVGGTTTDTVLRDGSLALTSDWDIGDTRKILTDEIRARDGAGLKLHDDDGNGIFVEDGGQVGVGTSTPSCLLNIDAGDITELTTIFNGHVKDSASIDRDFFIKNTNSGGNWEVGASWNSRCILRGYSVDFNPYSNGDFRFLGSGNFILNTYRFFLEGSTGNVGLGITTPTAKLDIDSDIFRVRSPKTPATAGADGNQGDICWDADYMYICVATNTWKRSGLSTW